MRYDVPEDIEDISVLWRGKFYCFYIVYALWIICEQIGKPKKDGKVILPSLAIQQTYTGVYLRATS